MRRATYALALLALAITLNARPATGGVCRTVLPDGRVILSAPIIDQFGRQSCVVTGAASQRLEAQRLRSLTAPTQRFTTGQIGPLTTDGPFTALPITPAMRAMPFTAVPASPSTGAMHR